MCHCIFFGINPRVNVSLKHHAVHLYRTTWWQLGLNSKEDFVFTVPIAGLSAGGAGPPQTPSIAIRRRRLHAVCSLEEVH